MQRMRAFYIKGLCCLLFLLLAGCSQSASTVQSTQTTALQQPQVVNMDASWAVQNRNLKELKQNSDVIVRGSVTSVVATIIPPPSQGVIATEFSFTVTNVLWDPHHKLSHSSTTIIIKQTGGNDHGTLFQVSDDPLFHIGEEAILGLREYSANHYFVIGGPSGRFVIQQGIVKPINDEGIALPGTTSESTFYTLLQQA